LSLVDNGYPFATTGTDPILLGYEPTNAVIDIGSTYWFPTISKSVEPVAKLYNALEETLNQVVNAFTGGSGGTEFSGFMQSIIQVMDNIMVAQLGAVVIGFITLILYTNKFIIGCITYIMVFSMWILGVLAIWVVNQT